MKTGQVPALDLNLGKESRNKVPSYETMWLHLSTKEGWYLLNETLEQLIGSL